MRYTFQPYAKTPLVRGHLNLGGANPQGGRIDVNNLYLERDGKPWVPIMGEFHFSRGSRPHWYRELCKMKAGGVTVVATYLFWIYHEEEEGRFDFTGDRDIRAFLLACQRAGLEAVIRIGPWAHGECRKSPTPCGTTTPATWRKPACGTGKSTARCRASPTRRAGPLWASSWKTSW